MKACSILLVEDEEYIRENLSEILGMHGYHVDVAATGESGVEMVRKKEYDIVLTDLRLPGMDGIEVVRNVKTITPDVACIILTGYATVETAVEAMRVGAFTYLKAFRKRPSLRSKAYESTRSRSKRQAQKR